MKAGPLSGSQLICAMTDPLRSQSFLPWLLWLIERRRKSSKPNVLALMEVWRMIHLATLRHALAVGLNYIITPVCESIPTYRELGAEVESLSSHRPLLARMRSHSQWQEMITEGSYLHILQTLLALYSLEMAFYNGVALSPIFRLSLRRKWIMDSWCTYALIVIHGLAFHTYALAWRVQHLELTKMCKCIWSFLSRYNGIPGKCDRWQWTQSFLRLTVSVSFCVSLTLCIVWPWLQGSTLKMISHYKSLLSPPQFRMTLTI